MSDPLDVLILGGGVIGLTRPVSGPNGSESGAHDGIIAEVLDAMPFARIDPRTERFAVE